MEEQPQAAEILVTLFQLHLMPSSFQANRFRNFQEFFFIFGISLGFTLLSFIAVEVYFQFRSVNGWVCEICRFDSELGWVTIPNKKVKKDKLSYSTNSRGFRSEKVDSSKDHILILGDSVAFGVGVNDNETLSHYLNKSKPEHQVLNLAVSGYSIDQYYLILKRNISRTNPKWVVVIIFSGNDWWETGQNTAYGVSKPLFEPAGDILTPVNLPVSRFSCHNLLTKSWTLSVFSAKKHLQNSCSSKHLTHESTKKIIFFLLTQIRNLAEKYRAKTLFVLSPTLSDFLLTTCGPNTNFSFCESSIKNHPNYILENIIAIRRYFLEKIRTMKIKNPKGSIKGVPHSGTWSQYLRFRNLLEESGWSFINYRNELMSNGVFPEDFYIKNDPFHYSPKGNEI